jgi:hypothetical protein
MPPPRGAGIAARALDEDITVMIVRQKNGLWHFATSIPVLYHTLKEYCTVLYRTQRTVPESVL